MTAPLIRLTLYRSSLNSIGSTYKEGIDRHEKDGLLFILSLILVFPLSQASAMDTDLYAVTSTEVPPNVMIMFDNSISMNELVSGFYTIQYHLPQVVTDYPDKVYYRTGGGSWNLYRDSIDLVSCDSVKIALRDYGFIPEKSAFRAQHAEQPTMSI